MYTLNWKNPALVINGIPDANKEMAIEVLPGSIVSNASPLTFTGKGAGNYGEIQQENLMRLLENFADEEENPPANPTVGMTWYDTTNSQLKLCVQSAPVKWRVIAGIIITNVDQPAPTGILGDVWFEKTGPLTGNLYTFTGTGRFPLDASTLGGWNQIWPQVDYVGGREEYDYVFGLINGLLGSTVFGGNGAITRSIQNINSLLPLDVALRQKYTSTPDARLIPTAADISYLKVDPISSDWDTLLAAGVYAINRLDVPDSMKTDISDMPFTQDGRQAPASLFALNQTDTRYPSAQRRALRRMGYLTLIRLYGATINALEFATDNRYAIKGINGSALLPTATLTTHAIFGGSQANKGLNSNFRMAFRFADKDSLERFLNSGGAIQLTTKHSTSQLGSADQDLSTLLTAQGNFRVTADKTRTMNSTFTSGGAPIALKGFKDATSSGTILTTNTNTAGTSSIKLTTFRVSDIRLDLDIAITAANNLLGTTIFKLQVIQDTETFKLLGVDTRVFPGPLAYATGDASGSSWFVLNTSESPPAVNVPAGTLLRTMCSTTTKVGIYSDGNGGEYPTNLQLNSPECGGTACLSQLFGTGSITIPSGVTAVTLTGSASTTTATTATADNQTKTFASTSSSTATITFGVKTTAKTLSYAIPAGGTLSMTYCSFVTTYPAAGTLIRTGCDSSFNKTAYYADGQGGENPPVIIQTQSAECGFVGTPSTTPAAVFSLYYGPVIGGSAPSTTVTYKNGWGIDVRNIAGFTPGQTYTITSVISGPSPKTETIGTFTATSGGTASDIYKSYTNAPPTWLPGSYTASCVIKNAAGATILTPPTLSFGLAAAGTGGGGGSTPTVDLYFNGSLTAGSTAGVTGSTGSPFVIGGTAGDGGNRNPGAGNAIYNVGDNVTVKQDFKNWKPNSPITAYFDISGADNRTTGPYAFTTDSTGFVTNTYVNTLLLNNTITGAVTYRLRTVGQNAEGQSVTIYSNSITVVWQNNVAAPTATLFMNNSSAATQLANVGDNVTVKQNFTNLKPGSAITFYMDLTGPDTRTVGPFTFTADTAGNFSTVYQSTLLINDTIRGAVTYKLRATVTDGNNAPRTISSNAITITWSKVAGIPTCALYLNNTQANSNVYVGDNIAVKEIWAGWAPNTVLQQYLVITGVDNRTNGPYPATSDVNGGFVTTYNSTLLINNTISGRCYYQVKTVGNNQNGVSTTILSNVVSIFYEPVQPVGSTTFNGAGSYTSAYVGDNVAVAVAGSLFKPYSTVTVYLNISGAENRSTGPFVFTADANGDIFNSFSSTLLASNAISGNVYYIFGYSGYKPDGSYTTFSSNTVTINWVKR